MATKFQEVGCSQEKRLQHRYKTIMRIGLLHRMSGKDLCMIKNISADGVMARTWGSLEAGEPVQVELREGHLLPGSVMWSMDGAIGIRFDKPVDVTAVLATEPQPELKPRMPRIDVACPARIRIGSRYYHATLRNLSLRGAAVETAIPIRSSGDAILMLPDLAPIQTQVRWSDGALLGMSFNKPLSLVLVVQWLQQRLWARLGTRESKPMSSPAGENARRALATGWALGTA